MDTTARCARPCALPGDRSADPSTEGGFTLVEVVVAMLVLTVALLALVPVQTRGLSGVVLAEERQQATGYADGALERVRGRSGTASGFAAVAAGRSPDPGDADDAANTTGCPGACRFRPSADPALDEALATPSTPPTTADAALATDTASTGGTTFTTRLYVTGVTPAATPALLTATAVTSWVSRNGGAAQRQVAVRTQIASPVAP